MAGKRCTKCGRTFPISEFHMLARGGRRADCRACVSDAATRRARERRAGRPTPPVGHCEDCGEGFGPRQSVRIEEPSEAPYRLCLDCWDRIISAAVALQALPPDQRHLGDDTNECSGWQR